MMNSSTWLALVALAEPVLPDPQAVKASCDAMAPDHAPLELSSVTPAMATYRWGDATVAFTLVDRPAPAGELVGPCEQAWYWPEAADQMARQQAHLIVALVDEGRDRVAKAMRLTQFAAALLPNSEAVGLQWGGSRGVHEPAAFCQVAAQMSRDDLPLHLWIAFQLEQAEIGLRLYTTGLAVFGKPEIEIARFAGSPQELLSHVYNLAHYLLRPGVEIKEGETIGLPGEVQVTARLTTTFLEGEEQVLQFDFE